MLVEGPVGLDCFDKKTYLYLLYIKKKKKNCFELDYKINFTKIAFQKEILYR